MALPARKAAFAGRFVGGGTASLAVSARSVRAFHFPNRRHVAVLQRHRQPLSADRCRQLVHELCCSGEVNTLGKALRGSTCLCPAKIITLARQLRFRDGGYRADGFGGHTSFWGCLESPSSVSVRRMGARESLWPGGKPQVALA